MLLSDDKSELSLGKESSLSITKNTLLSPSTDEEDLFDVPPDLPEDPHKEDLFGRAPILSPALDESPEISKEDIKEEINESDGPIQSVTDPLRSSQDPLKDPSQLFAFVTKTPSPEKSKDLVNPEEDDSLFSQIPKKSDSGAKKALDLFADDDNSGDLFSGPFTRAIGKKSVKEAKGSLFDDTNSDEDHMSDDLFGSVSSKKSDNEKSINETDASPSGHSPKLRNVIADEDEEDDEELFFDASEKPSDANKEDKEDKEDSLFPSTGKISKTKLEDIFGDANGDDIFSAKSDGNSGLFANDANYSNSDGLIASKSDDKSKIVKKSVTRDLKKTAEKIVEDPLSMFQDE